MPGLTPQAYRHMKNPHNTAAGVSSDSICGRAGIEGQGPFFQMFLQLAGERVSAAGFRTICCPWANAIGSAATHLIEGRSVEQARELTASSVSEELGGVPRSKRDLLGLALVAVSDALSAAGVQAIA